MIAGVLGDDENLRFVENYNKKASFAFLIIEEMMRGEINILNCEM